MNMRAVEEEESVSVSGQELDIQADIEWQMLDKWKFFLCEIGVSVARHEGFRALYRGFGTSLMGTIPARAVYIAALKVTKSKVGSFAVSDLGFTAAVASAVGGLSAAMVAQLVWTLVNVVTQRLMVANGADARYVNGVDMFRKIVRNDGVRGLYRGFGISILTNAPSNAVWWPSYSVAQRLVWGGVGCFLRRKYGDREGDMMMIRPDSKTVMAFQGVSAAMAGGLSALITMPLIRLKRVKSLVKEGGWMACYRGLGPRWASMSISATTMITTYEFLKRTSAKNPEVLT
ncbi:mitochondrial substrate carrier family protein j [Citrus sinensis]|nr:mitochondrial substrate carrier family protein j [Citrus sinensis]